MGRFHTQWQNLLYKEMLLMQSMAHGASHQKNYPVQPTLVYLSSPVPLPVLPQLSYLTPDTLLSKVNKAGAGGDGPMVTRLANIAKETGFVNLCTVGLLPRCVMIGSLTAGQFGIFDSVMNVLGASKFHFTDPSGAH